MSTLQIVCLGFILFASLGFGQETVNLETYN